MKSWNVYYKQVYKIIG